MTATPTAPVRAVVFDFAGVLTTPIAPSFAFVQEAVGIPDGALGRALAAIAARDGRNPLHELECGRVSEEAFMRSMADAIADDLGRPVPMQRFSEHYFDHLRANDAMLALVRTLRARGYRTALLTNNVREWGPRWRAMFPVDELFELVVDSAFVDMRKPDPRIYALTCERLGLPPEACLFVDDVAQNVDAARAHGMAGVWFQTTPQAIAAVETVLGPTA